MPLVEGITTKIGAYTYLAIALCHPYFGSALNLGLYPTPIRSQNWWKQTKEPTLSSPPLIR